jgi:hypothetical protein
VTSLPAVVKQDWIALRRVRLHLSGHFPRMCWITTIILIARDKKSCGVVYIVTHPVIRRICKERSEIISVFNCSVFTFPPPRLVEMLITEHIEQRRNTKGSAKKIRPLSDCRPNQQAGVRATKNRQPSRRCDSLRDKPFGSTYEVVEGRPAISSPRCFMPYFAEFLAATDIWESKRRSEFQHYGHKH